MTGRRIGTLCVILGSLCILAAGLLLGHNLREEHRAAAATQLQGRPFTMPVSLQVGQV